MSDDVAGYVGNIPEHYDRHLVPLLFTGYASEISRRAAACAPRRVLELAAGTGIVTRHLRDLLPEAASLTATDLNSPMLEIARTRFRSDEAVEFQPADATALPFAADNFDVVVCQFGVMFFPDKDQSYREVFRVLVRGGRYLFSVWDSHRYNAFGRIVHEVVGRFFPADPPQFATVPFGYRFEPIKDSLLEAGFTNIQATVIRLQTHGAELASLARGQVYGSPLIDHIRERGGVEAEQVVAALAQEYRRVFGSDPASIPLQAIMFSAEKPS